MENKEYVKIVLDFLKEAGEIALKYQYTDLKNNLKSDTSIVTEADLMISKLFKDRIKPFLSTGKHCLLDEESISSKADIFNSKYEYLWTIDPIDGTTTYFHGFPNWSIAVGLYRNLEPVLGFIYMPAMKELIYTDGNKTYYINNFATVNQTECEVALREKKLTNKSIILEHKLQNFDRLKYITLDLYSAYVLAFYTFLSRSSATFLNSPEKLWDITATIPIAKSLGISIRNVKDDKPITKLSDDLINDDWRLKNVYLMCMDGYYKDIKSILYK